MASLFNDRRFYELANNKLASMESKINKLDKSDFEDSSIDELAEKFHNDMRFETPTLREAEISQKPPEDITINHRGRGYSSGAKIPGTMYTLVLPFDGYPDMLGVFPSSHSTILPKGEIEGDEIRIVYRVPVGEDAAAPIKADFDRNLNLIKEYLGYLSNDVNTFNDKLLAALKVGVERRRQKLDKDDETARDLGFPIK